MKPLTKVLLVICLIGLVLGLGNIGSAIISGLALALGAVFFELALICKLLEAPEEEELAVNKVGH